MPEGKSPRVLVVDDMAMNRKLIDVLATSLGCEIVAEAEDGIVATAKYRETKPDLVFLDIEMPRKDGHETLKSLLRIDRQAYVVMLTSVDNPFIAENLIISGAKDFVVKDFESDELKGRLAEVIGAWRDQAE